MSARSNEDRLGIAAGQSEENSLQQPTLEGGTLKFITPTEFVDLPSKGEFYPPNHPLHKQEVAEIRHMTTKEEDILTSITLLKKGLALDRMLESILVDKRIKIDDLLMGDKNALIIAARTHGYGPIYDTHVECPNCSNRQEYSFDMGALECQSAPSELMSKRAIQKTEVGTFLVPIPQTDYVVETRLLTGHHEKKILEIQEHKKQRNFHETTATDFLRAIIVSVNNIGDEKSINEFINSLPALHGRYLRRTYEKVVPALDMKHSFICASCNHEGVLEVPLNTDFFWFNA
jgi:hypothetical protein